MLTSLATGCAVAGTGGDSTDSDAGLRGIADAAQGAPDATRRPWGDASGPGEGDATGSPPDAEIPCATGALELLANGDFDQGTAAPWIEASDGGFPLIADASGISGVTAESGSFLSWMGGYVASGNSATDEIYQDVSVPTDATPPTISGALWVLSDEGSSVAFDTLELQIVDASTGMLLETAAQWSNTDQGSGWTHFSHDLGASYAGQELRVRFVATVDDLLLTNFLLDTLSLETTSCR